MYIILKFFKFRIKRYFKRTNESNCNEFHLFTRISFYTNRNLQVLINELNKKKQTITEKINSYSFSRDLKKEGN